MPARKLATCIAGSAAPASRAFVQLASRRAAAQSPSPFLDFLMPTRMRASLAKPATSRAQIRHFTAGRRLQETKCIVNPRTDEDGEMTMEITPRAAHRLSQIAAKDKNPDIALRITVESGGCHGFQYLMSLTSIPQEASSPAALSPNPPTLDTNSSADAKSGPETTLTEDDTVFAFVDPESGETKARIVMDEPSLELLKGSKVDYTMELIGSQFKIVDNPKASSSCGCGTSFDVKF